MQDLDRAVPPLEASQPAYDRRRGPRRGVDAEMPVERRHTDRRVRKPGLPALFGAIFADEDDETVED